MIVSELFPLSIVVYGIYVTVDWHDDTKEQEADRSLMTLNSNDNNDELEY